jgi:CelD/BcsL family acetyltransferase involved in cellulose biosynthesis
MRVAASPASVLRGEDVLQVFGPAWDRLAEANPCATAFQSRGWYRAWLEAVAAAEEAEPLVLQVPAAGPARAALALQVCRVQGEPALRPLSWPWADYHDAVGDPNDAEAAESLATALTDLVEESGLSLVLDDVVASGFLVRVMERLGIAAEAASPVGAIDLTNAERLERLRQRREHHRKEHQLARHGEVRCVHRRDREEIARRLPVFIEMHRRQWEEQPDAVAPFDGGVVDAAFAAMVRHMAPDGRVVLTELLVGGEAVATYFGFVWGRAYLGYRTSYEFSWYRLSPGHLMLRAMIRDFAAAGLERLDLMRGAYAYKAEYVDTFRHNRRYRLGAARAAEGAA